MKSRLPTLMGLWQPVVTTLDEWTQAVREFDPLGLTHWPAHDRRGDSHGQVVWGVERGARSVGLCWEWCELRPGVVVLVNPMAVCSNARLIGATGETLPHGSQLLAWNGALHGLPWQAGVARELARRRARRAAAAAQRLPVP